MNNMENLQIMYDMIREGLDTDSLPDDHLLLQFARRAYAEGYRNGVAETDPVKVQTEDAEWEAEGMDPMELYYGLSCYFLEFLFADPQAAMLIKEYWELPDWTNIEEEV